ncbi:MAG: hypothetical protein Q9184_006187 [Pyrenodesmia sp. 2 TL-2023]
MDAIVSTADELGTHKRSHTYGVSLSGDVAMNSHSVQAAAPMDNHGIQCVLLMVAKEVFVKERRFQELEFTYLDHGRLSAEGFFRAGLEETFEQYLASRSSNNRLGMAYLI